MAIRLNKKHFTRQYLPVGLCLTAGVILAIAVSILVKKWEDANNQAQFQQRISNLTTALNRTVNRYTEVLYSLRDLYDSTTTLVSRSQFEAFTERAVTSYRGIQALEWAKRIPNSEKIGFEQSMQKSGFSKFQIYERDRNSKPIPVKERLEYIPVLYINPLIKNEVALGFDLASDLERYKAIDRARISRKISTTGRIKLVQEKKDQYGFLVFLAIYRNQLQARQEPEGYILGVFRVTDVIEESLQGINNDIDFIVSFENSDRDFLGFYRSKTKSFLSKPPSQNRQNDSLCSDRITCLRKISVGDRTWLIQFQPTESYGAKNRNWLPEAVKASLSDSPNWKSSSTSKRRISTQVIV
jgi:CHASE1-domain containing sensor protein